MTYDTSNRKERKFANWGEYIYWIYANINMCMAALARRMDSYNRYSFMIRAKAFKAYKEGRWHINSLYKNNNWKMDLGKEFCWYCGRPVEECGTLTAEHILPRAKGGDDSFDNIAYACKKCNSSKGDRDLIEWLCSIFDYVPSLFIVCIYMKLVYKYSVENGLMELHSEELDQMDLPFNYRSLMAIKQFVDDEYLRIYRENTETEEADEEAITDTTEHGDSPLSHQQTGYINNETAKRKIISTDGAARAEGKLAYIMPSRDRGRR